MAVMGEILGSARWSTTPTRLPGTPEPAVYPCTPVPTLPPDATVVANGHDGAWAVWSRRYG
jgi:hypothetical protein